jgi:hypothetical protein
MHTVPPPPPAVRVHVYMDLIYFPSQLLLGEASPEKSDGRVLERRGRVLLDGCVIRCE